MRKSLVRMSGQPRGREGRRYLGRIALSIVPLVTLVAVLTTNTTAAATPTGVLNLVAAPSPVTPGVSATFAISFTLQTALGLNSTITVDTAPGTTFTACTSGCASDGYQLVRGTSTISIASVKVPTPNDFIITLNTASIPAGTSVSILAPDTNPQASGFDTLALSTSKDTSPVSVAYTIGNESGGLIQGAYPNGGLEGAGASIGPIYGQSLFGAPTMTTPTMGSIYLGTAAWTTIDGGTPPSNGFKGFSAYAIPGHQLVIGVPMLPKTSGTLAIGETGAYDQYWEVLADNFVRGPFGRCLPPSRV